MKKLLALSEVFVYIVDLLRESLNVNFEDSSNSKEPCLDMSPTCSASAPGIVCRQDGMLMVANSCESTLELAVVLLIEIPSFPGMLGTCARQPAGLASGLAKTWANSTSLIRPSMKIVLCNSHRISWGYW